MFVLKPTCRKGLHPMIGDSYRLETYRSRNGTTYIARRCKACQSRRYKTWLRKKQEEAHEQDPV